ncbi:uncharacterized protein KY384_003370 [Bacidia gigantensis]|uniref:uncharacterized protein n=1 Tax=Bacidia gigantensis TaxID=2732470 RepID=UPI001D03A533|nr:uncharacterized protein KY384_003370 [Bacidia gigantensis]KAG8531738.1 hypothetical protein KY384_003370 [Bacidia gigantensis]
MRLELSYFVALQYFSFAVASNLVKTSQVSYVSVTANGVESFLGIPFAESVSGEKRFTRPTPKKWSQGHTFNATQPGPACPQAKVPVQDFIFQNVTNAKEDCLNLRVDRPANVSAGAKLPVMVYIYGGGDSIGQAYDQLYSPQGIVLGSAGINKPVIYVAMNYRLNIFGFAASAALSAEGNTNLGLRDQRLALEWVQQNIAYFGGDPENVTIFGESDGATGVGLQCTAFGGKGGPVPFHRMILESGAPAADPLAASDFVANNTAEVAKDVGCLSSDSAQTLACLRRVPYDKLLNATLTHDSSLTAFGFDVFIGNAGDDFIPAAPSELVRSGRFCRNVPLIIGWNLNDASLFTDSSLTDSTVASYFRESFPGLTNDTLAKMLSLYPASEFTTMPGSNASAGYYRASRIERDIEFVCPALQFALAASHYSNAKAFVYQLEQTPLENFFAESNNSNYGVSHFSDIFYVFNEVQGFSAVGPTQSDIDLGTRVSGSWELFANNGVPGNSQLSKQNASLADWPAAFTPTDVGTCELGDVSQLEVFAIGGSHEGPVMVKDSTTHQGLDKLLERCAFLTTPEFFAQIAT